MMTHLYEQASSKLYLPCIIYLLKEGTLFYWSHGIIVQISCSWTNFTYSSSLVEDQIILIN